jgi:hypothetical protein
MKSNVSHWNLLGSEKLVYNSQGHLVYGLCPASGFLNNFKTPALRKFGLFPSSGADPVFETFFSSYLEFRTKENSTHPAILHASNYVLVYVLKVMVTHSNFSLAGYFTPAGKFWCQLQLCQ